MGAKFLDALDDVTLDATQEDWRGGVKESGRPTRLLPNQFGSGQNLILDDADGTPKTRPGADALGGAALTAARIDRLFYFDTQSVEALFAAVSASLRQWDGAAWTNVAGYPFGANNISDMAQGNNLLYLSDATGNWNSFDGTATWADLGSGVGNPPVGASMMCWHTDRMFASGVITSGGITYDDAIYVSDLGDAGAGKWNHSTWQFRVGRGEGEPVKALCSAKGWWLAVGKEQSIYLVNADPTAASAAAWAIKRLAGSIGVVGKRAMASAGDSFFVVAPDKSLREIVPTAAEETPFELLPPASEPAQPYFNRINWAQQSKIALHKYGRWLLMACPLDGASDNNTVLVWDLRYRVPGSTGNVAFPAFLGIWTGWTPTAFATTRFGAVGEMLVIGDTAGMVNEWKDTDDETLEATYTDNDAEIATLIRTMSFDFGTQRNWKDAESVEVQFVESWACVTIDAVLDGVSRMTWEVATEVISNQLPVNLPFDLAEGGPYTATKSSDGLIEFTEMYLELRSDSGRVEVRRAAASAFLNTTRTE